MKKLVLVQAAAFALLLSVGSASAEESVPPVSEMPLDQGIVVDVSGGSAVVDPTAATGVEVSTQVIDAATEDAKANDGTVLPLDQGDVNASEIDAGGQTVEVSPAVVAPEKDTVVLTEKKPVVEKLPKTGIADHGLLYASLAALLATIAIFFTRGRKAEQA